jgi:hypothetical protein
MTTEEKFLPFFQKEISIVLDNKVLRQGKLLLFSIKDFYLHFTLLLNNNTKVFELPYPFFTYMESVTSKTLVLDYSLKSFTRELSDISEKANSLCKKEKHMKFFNNIIRVVETF